MEPFKIFLVEDDPAIARAILTHLTAWDYKVEAARDFHQVLPELLEFSPHLVLLDISLPYQNGFYWCTELRKSSNVPVIFISSAADNFNVITAVNLGGDDFIAKPFDLSVLTAKIQAILRRAYSLGADSARPGRNGAELDVGESALLFEGRKMELTKNECRILRSLLESGGRPVSRTKLMEQLWQDESFVDENTLNVSIARLRKKLEGFGLSGFVATKKNVGYYIP